MLEGALMETITIPPIAASLRKLPMDKLAEVYDFILFLSERTSIATIREDGETYAIDTMLASEDVLRRDWDTPEEDAAWAHL
jgi:hypothetical protein